MRSTFSSIGFGSLLLRDGGRFVQRDLATDHLIGKLRRVIKNQPGLLHRVDPCVSSANGDIPITDRSAFPASVFAFAFERELLRDGHRFLPGCHVAPVRVNQFGSRLLLSLRLASLIVCLVVVVTC